ncbi:uncharacterized protein MONOS_1015 [Monocercomonoides exilis]|uniref:uncharacterized protein n=1 Tax=Monocercomonoides exilis TaxID=2049356 RepID=UPI00355938CF|nr:hypothetical protein MONOS_1015 [Monocercomonoides exilis]|eukprot:MONOS_1015.1-p1 / transcript=MONOS_1015.1 / gene=MONOS_1015 / organism=Monocercomonoides_exilis_PA203 / gene_product=unspecified product / transcript_product=unspecified product / location=Mono_scaffold00017:50916-51881(+) / protein_length=322 / sequence_SO=supercontig / SO=protein_coding / is_pseudo=false
MIIEHRKDLSEKLNADDLENCALKPMVDIVYRQDNTTHKCGFNRIERMRKRRKEQKKKKKLKIKEEKEQERLRQCAEYEEEMKRKQNETIQKNEKVQIPLKHLVFELETEEYATHSQTPTSSPEAQDQAEELPEPNSFPISPSPLLSSAAMSSSSSCCSSPQTTSPSPSATSEPFFSEVDLSAHFIPTKTEKMADDLCYQEENDQSGTKKTRLTNHSHYQEEMQANTSIEKNQSADETYEPGTNLSINTLRKKMSEEGTFSEVVFENHDELLEEGEIDSDKEAIENETLMVNEKFVDTLEIITKKGCSINFEKAIEQLQVI